MRNDDSLMIYHILPQEIRGDTLYPLNQLRFIYPEIFELEVKKYDERQFLLERKIPKLDCLWNDVLFFSNICPNQVLDVLRECGANPPPIPNVLKLDLEDLDDGSWIIYHEPITGEVITTTDPSYLKDHRTIPETVRNEFTRTIRQGCRPFLFGRLPHILYKGSIKLP